MAALFKRKSFFGEIEVAVLAKTNLLKQQPKKY
jgi:hypothetical protein